MKQHDILLDKMVKHATVSELIRALKIKVLTLNLNSNQYKKWVKLNFPNYLKVFKSIYRKKLVEFYSSYVLLDIKKDDVYMDAAGGRYAYAHKIICKKGYLQDLRVMAKQRKELNRRVTIVESSAANIPLPNKSVNCISCHHSFEHFKRNADIGFIKEVCRLLKPGGRAVIVPILIGNRYLEVINDEEVKENFDKKAKVLFDESASLPGSCHSGHFARIYSPQAFKRRVLNNINKNKFDVVIYQVKMDNKLMPIMSAPGNNVTSKINYPYWALYIACKK